MSRVFSFENLDVYQLALAFTKQIYLLTKSIKLHYSWRDQLNRASSSIVLNIAEGSGRWHAKDKRNFYYIARGSAFECVPLIELGLSLDLLTEKQYDELRAQIFSISNMLTKLAQSTDKK